MEHKQLIKSIKNECGVWSSLVLIFLVTMALMGLGAAYLARSESKNTSNQIKAIQADYAANGAAYFAIRQLQVGELNESYPYTVGSASVSLDTSDIAGSSDMLLTVLATVDGIERGVEIRLSSPKGLRDHAIFTTDHVYNVSGKDSSGTIDPDLVTTQAPEIPTIDEDSLSQMSTLQGHDQYVDPFEPADGYPNWSFYQADGVTPNVTHVMGDFSVQGGRNVFGIFIVEGDVVLHGSARVEGVIYLPNPTSTVITGGGNPSESTVTGGIISHGDITGMGNHISVKHWPDYMDEFCDRFQIGPDNTDIPIVKWQFI